MLWTLQRVYLGKLNEKWADLKDLDKRELIMFIPLTILIILLGVYPSLALDIMNTSVNTLVQFVNTNFANLTSLTGL